MINELLLARKDAVIYYLVRGGLGFKIGVRLYVLKVELEYLIELKIMVHKLPIKKFFLI